MPASFYVELAARALTVIVISAFCGTSYLLITKKLWVGVLCTLLTIIFTIATVFTAIKKDTAYTETSENEQVLVFEK